MAQPPAQPEDLYRDYVVPGNALSGAYRPEKALLRAYERWLLDAVQTLLGAGGLDPDALTNLQKQIAAVSALVDKIQTIAQPSDGAVDGDPVALAIVDAMSRAVAWATMDGRFVIASHRGLTQDGVDIPEMSDPRWLYAYADGGNAIAGGVRASGDWWDARSLASPFADLGHIVVLSQSLGVGVQSFPQLAGSVSVWGGLQYVRGQMTWQSDSTAQQPWIRFDSDMALSDLAPNPVNEIHGAGETIAFGLCDGLKARITGRYTPNPQARTFPRLLWSNACEGARYLTEIGPEDSSNRAENNGARAPGGYYRNTLEDLRFGRAAAWDRAWSYGVTATVFMQGEAERGTMSLYPFQSAMAPSALITAYRDKLIATHEQFNTDQVALSGNAVRVPMFSYQTCDPFIGEAQRQAALQGRDLFMASPTYFMPSALNSVIGTGSGQTYGQAIHITADSERWLGEMFAKIMHRVLVRGDGWRPLQPVRCQKVDAQTIDIDFHVPVGHLVLDTTFLAKARGFGFQVWSNTADERYAGTATQIQVSSVTAITGSRIRLTLASAMATGTAYHVVYGNEYACDLGVTPSVASTRAGPNTANGFPTTELVLSADITSAFASLVAEGAFNVGKGAVQAPIRLVYRDSTAGVTVLRYENREISGGSSFATGALDAVARPRQFGNLRDADPALAFYNWSAAPYGSRSGPYPLWNWCVFFDNLVVS